MSAIIMSGKDVATSIKNSVKNKILSLPKAPKLAIIHIGNDPASAVYIKGKLKDCEECGINCDIMDLTNEKFKSVLSLIHGLDCIQEVNGIILQLPLPKDEFTEQEEKKLISSIIPAKDVDCFAESNVYKMYSSSNYYDLYFTPCTPAGIIKILEYYNIDIAGKHCVIIGRSNIVGKPMAALMLQHDATVTVCHSKTPNLGDITTQADILISAVGKANTITKDMVKPGAVVIDVGINRNSEGKLCWDVDFENVKEVASYITPVPGGVGLTTRAILMENTVKAAYLQYGLIY